MLLARRDFLKGQIQFLSALAVGYFPNFFPTKKYFITQYKISHSSHNQEKCLSFFNRFKDGSCRSFQLFEHELSNEWKNNYNNVRQNFISKGKILDSYYVYDNKDFSVAIVNLWNSENSFAEFKCLTDIERLTKLYRKSDFNISIENGTSSEHFLKNGKNFFLVETTSRRSS